MLVRKSSCEQLVCKSSCTKLVCEALVQKLVCKALAQSSCAKLLRKTSCAKLLCKARVQNSCAKLVCKARAIWKAGGALSLVLGPLHTRQPLLVAPHAWEGEVGAVLAPAAPRGMARPSSVPRENAPISPCVLSQRAVSAAWPEQGIG